MSYTTPPRDVRVTPRNSVRSPFIPPDIAPVPTIVRELLKGEQGWTDHDVKVPNLATDHRPRGHAGRVLDAYRVGNPIPRQTSTTARAIRTRYNAGGPSAAYRAAQQRAAALAARGME